MIVKCHYCGKKFSHYGNYGIKWCSTKCQDADRKKKLKSLKDNK